MKRKDVLIAMIGGCIGALVTMGVGLFAPVGVVGLISAHRCRGIMHGSQKQSGAQWLGIGIRKGGDSDEAVAGWIVGVADGMQRRRKEFSS